MEEEFYAAIKLVTGEEIFSLVCVDENNGDSILILENPVVMKSFTNRTGTFIKIKPWMEIPDDDLYIIKSDKVVTMTEIKDSLTIKLYKKFIEGNDDDEDEYIEGQNISDSGQVNISKKMGYISSVEEARKKLEKLYKNNKEI